MPKRKRCGFPAASPEEESLAQGPLKKIRIGTQLEVHTLGSLAGVAHVILRHGRCVFTLADGWADIKRQQRFGVDTICRLHGSSKSLVCAAFLTLVDNNKVKLDDPVSKYINFSEQVVKKNGNGTRRVITKPTLRHLLMQSAGLLYTDCPAYAKVISATRSGKINSLSVLCDALADVPLQFEPGSRYEYSFCTDFMGRVCEVVSGERLDHFVAGKVLKPLGMKDTHFVVPPSKHQRMAVLYECKESSSKSRSSKPYVPKPWDHPDSAPGIMSAGGGVLSYKDAGMWSTARDYAKFCQMLLDGGVARGSGARVLKASTIRQVWTDGLTSLRDRNGRLCNWNVNDKGTSLDVTDGPPFKGGSWNSCGWSLLNSLLQFDGPPKISGTPSRAHNMGLGGGGGTYWCVDARRQLVALTFTQSFNGGRPEDDGLGPPGNDCVDLAIAAVNEAAEAVKTKFKRDKRR